MKIAIIILLTFFFAFASALLNSIYTKNPGTLYAHGFNQHRITNWIFLHKIWNKKITESENRKLESWNNSRSELPIKVIHLL
jgi:hypothetical protein